MSKPTKVGVQGSGQFPMTQTQFDKLFKKKCAKCGNAYEAKCEDSRICPACREGKR